MGSELWLSEPNIVIFFIFGLLIGSFLNVVIHRLPKILENQWAQEAAQYNGTELPTSDQPYNLIKPGSACPKCHTPLTWANNLPVISYLIQRGRCTHCGVSISIRYPLVELACALLFAACAWHFPITITALAWAGFCAVLLAATAIDWDTSLLPDVLTLPLMWAGLLCSALGWVALPLNSAVWGAAIGYLSLWSVYWVFKWVTGKEGMGYGDFKLLAALGAWLGPVAIIPILLISCIIGAAIGIGLKMSNKLSPDNTLPFGPYLALAGLVLCFAKAEVFHWLGFA
jgi:leader peptidase (prepilin peptidase) / N-methyltransferase